MSEQIVKTTLVINAQETGSESIEKVLDRLIEKAETLNNLLGKLQFGDVSGLSGRGKKGGASGGSSVDQQGADGGEGDGGGKARKRGRKSSSIPEGGGGSGGSSGDDADDVTDKEAEKAEKEKQRKQRERDKMMQRGRYAIAVGAGMLGRMVSSRFTGYYEGIEGSRAIETAGAYSGDIFQAASSARQAEAMRQQAYNRNMSGAAWLGAGSSAVQMAGTGLAMMGGWGALAAGIGVTALGTLGNIIAGSQMAKTGANINVSTAKTTSAIDTLQQIQNQTMNLLTLQRNLIPFGGNFYAVSNRDPQGFLASANKMGYTQQEAQSMMNRFAAAGGRLRRDKYGHFLQDNWETDFLRYQMYGNVSPETLGKFERAFYPGGGIVQSYQGAGGVLATSQRGNLQASALNATVNAATSAGVPIARLDEWINRSSGYMQRYAERNVNINPMSQWSVGSYLPSSVQGFARQAGTENMGAFGMNLADQLNEMLMPTELAQGLVLSEVMGRGGKPGDWKKTLANPDAMKDVYSKVSGYVGDMLREPFIQSISGLMGVESFGPGQGPAVNVGYPDQIYKHPSAPEPGSIRQALSEFAENMAKYTDELSEAINKLQLMKKQIDIAITNAGNTPITVLFPTQ